MRNSQQPNGSFATDEHHLIEESIYVNDSHASIWLYLLVQLLPYLYLFTIQNHRFFARNCSICLTLYLISFFAVRSYFGYHLVGLSWYFDFKNANSFPFIYYYSRPVPFVATTTNSNVFWLSLFGINIVSIVLSIISLFLGVIPWFITFLIVFILGIFNLSRFIKCHNVAKEKVDEIARSLLLDTGDFQNVSESLSSDEEKND